MKTKYVFLILIVLTALMVYAAQLLIGPQMQREGAIGAEESPLVSSNSSLVTGR